jgi:RimJ/RimL family protein N-acetyltransferase
MLAERRLDILRPFSKQARRHMRDKKKNRKPDTKTPFFCAQYQQFELWYEGVGWDLKRTDAMMQGRENTRYADICGDDVGAMAGEGWEFIADPVCFTATHGNDRVIASAWAAPMRTEEDEVGCNLTYAVDERYEGRSLARLLACLAFLACDQMHAGMDFANIESRVDNTASLALARSLGFTLFAEGDFTMPVAGAAAEVAFRCLRVDRSILRFHAERTLEKYGLLDLLSLIRRARRPRKS